MKIAVFSSHAFEKNFLIAANAAYSYEMVFFEAALSPQTALLAKGFDCASCFVSDDLSAETLENLHRAGVKLIALRSAGYNNVDLEAAERWGITVVRVPAYSPHAVAEYAVALLLSLNRKTHRAAARVHEMNFSIEGLVGFDLFQKTVGVIGTGRIGTVFAKIMKGFGCRVLAYDIQPDPALAGEVEYTSLEQLYRNSDVISLHLPLLPETRHLIDEKAFQQMKPGAFLINTGRGGLIDTAALILALKRGRLGGAGLDVYEEEEGVFFCDLSATGLKDDVLARLLTFPQVMITSHQGFLTREALQNIAKSTLKNISDFESKNENPNQVFSKTHLVKSKLPGPAATLSRA